MHRSWTLLLKHSLSEEIDKYFEKSPRSTMVQMCFPCSGEQSMEKDLVWGKSIWFLSSLWLMIDWFLFSLRIMVYYSKSIQIKVSQRKRGIGQGPGKLHAWSFQLPSVSDVVWTVFTCLRNDVWWYTQSIDNQGSSPHAWGPECYWGSVT